MIDKRPPVSLARRVWPALAVAGASAAFISALDRPTQFVTDKVSLTGSNDTAAPTAPVNLPATSTTAAPVVSPVEPAVVPTTIPPVPVSVPKTQTKTQTKTTTPAAPAAPAAPASSGGACTGQPINGPVVQTRWGPVQVQAQLDANHQVCNVVALQTPNSHNRSVQINNYAKPILHKRAVAAGSAQFNGVSGATITSRGYMASLQYIIDHA